MEPIWRDVFRRAELGPRHIHSLIGVSRESASQWFNGWTKPKPERAARLEALAECVERALEDGRLPVPKAGMKSSEQRAHVIRILVEDYGAEYPESNSVPSGHPTTDGAVLRGEAT